MYGAARPGSYVSGSRDLATADHGEQSYWAGRECDGHLPAAPSSRRRRHAPPRARRSHLPAHAAAGVRLSAPLTPVSPILATAGWCDPFARCQWSQHRSQRSTNLITERAMTSKSGCCGTRGRIKCSSPSRTDDAASWSRSPFHRLTPSMHSSTRTPTAPPACSQTSVAMRHDRRPHHIPTPPLPNQRDAQEGGHVAPGKRGATWSPRGSPHLGCAVAPSAARTNPRRANPTCGDSVTRGPATRDDSDPVAACGTPLRQRLAECLRAGWNREEPNQKLPHLALTAATASSPTDETSEVPRWI